LKDDTVTIRDRDTMLQERVAISELDRIVSEKVDLRKLLSRIATETKAAKFNV
jgi:glycyl-tRNA synthetase